MRVRPPVLLQVVLLVVVAALMIGAMRQESATVDETVFLGAGWSYWQGYRYRLNPEHPPLMQLLAARAAASLACVLLAYPQFICYMNPLAGGTENGYRHLLDSNYDWGQDVIRLRKFLDERGIDKIYLQYFGTQAAIEYYRIPNDFVDSETAQRIQQGYLVVSVQALMRPEWKWLRESRQPIARVGYTLFVYQIGRSISSNRSSIVTAVDCTRHRCAYKPSNTINCSCVPRSMTRPDFSTMI